VDDVGELVHVVLCTDVLLVLKPPSLDEQGRSRRRLCHIGAASKLSSSSGASRLHCDALLPLSHAKVDVLWEAAIGDSVVERGFSIGRVGPRAGGKAQHTEEEWTLVAGDAAAKFEWVSELSSAIALAVAALPKTEAASSTQEPHVSHSTDPELSSAVDESEEGAVNTDIGQTSAQPALLPTVEPPSPTAAAPAAAAAAAASAALLATPGVRKQRILALKRALLQRGSDLGQPMQKAIGSAKRRQQRRRRQQRQQQQQQPMQADGDDQEDPGAGDDSDPVTSSSLEDGGCNGGSAMCDEHGRLLEGVGLPESDEAALVLRDAMLAQLHTLIQADMRRFLLSTAGLGTLARWAATSEWAHDTGGGAEAARAERGEWCRLFQATQMELASQFGLDADMLPQPTADGPLDPSPARQSCVAGDMELLLPPDHHSCTSPQQGTPPPQLRLSVRLPALAATPLSIKTHHTAHEPPQGLHEDGIQAEKREAVAGVGKAEKQEQLGEEPGSGNQPAAGMQRSRRTDTRSKDRQSRKPKGLFMCCAAGQ
jgi:hypothetical protein